MMQSPRSQETSGVVWRRAMLIAASIGTCLLSACVVRISSGSSSAGTPAVSGGGGATAPEPSRAGAISPVDTGGRAPDKPPIVHVVPVAGEWVNVTGNLAGMHSECGNLGLIAAKPDEDVLLVGVALNGLWASTTGGDSWHRIDGGTGSDAVMNRIVSFVFDADNPRQFWESGSYGEGAYLTRNNGESFTRLGDAVHADFISVDFTDPVRNTLLLGPHERERLLYRSKDGGKTWSDIGSNLPEGSGFSSVPLVLGPTTYLIGTANGIFRTEDGGASWTPLLDGGVIVAPLTTAEHGVFWVTRQGGLIHSGDGGESFSEIVPGGTLNVVSAVELPDGRLAALTQDTVVVSSDLGKSWSTASPPLPYNSAAFIRFTYSRFRKAFYLSHFTCGDNPAVPDDAVLRYDFDYEQ